MCFERSGGLGAQYEYFSAQVEVKRFDQTRSNWIESLTLGTGHRTAGADQVAI